MEGNDVEKRALIDLNKIRIEDPVWSKYTRLVTKEIIPYQWEALHDRIEDAEPSHCISNFQVAAGLKQGTFQGFVCQDTDLAKWIEAAAYSLSYERNEELEKKVEEAIDLIEKAQQEDGYINTYFTILAPNSRWKNLREGHELYTAGHMREAAVAYYKVTGKKRFVNIMEKFADLICQVFWQEEYQHAVPGHQEIEIGLIKMSEVNGKKEYLDMAKAFIDRRGMEPNYLVTEHQKEGWIDIFHDRNTFLPEYSQCHKPVREQETAEGHSVRAVYMYCAMADLAVAYEDESLLHACKRLWNNIVERRMYITGGIGSSGPYERFTVDYDLPNNTNYSESCASIGLALFSRRMAQITGESRYIDVMEQALYNTVLAGIAMDGKNFFYVNPLEVWPNNCIGHSGMEHVKPKRQKWFACACCPPNITRTLASLGEYIVFERKEEILVNLFISSTMRFEEKGITLIQEANFPYDEHVILHVKAEKEYKGGIGIRIPSYVKEYTIWLDGKEVTCEVKKGYAMLYNNWKEHKISIQFIMPATFIRANPNVIADIGKVAVKKGPVVYCLEEIDNGADSFSLFVETKKGLEEVYREDLFGGVTVIRGKGRKMIDNWESHVLYGENDITWEDREITLVPYAYWGNRGYGEMQVWMKEIL